MSSTENYRFEEREPAKGVNFPPFDVYVNQGEHIPIDRNWADRKCTLTSLFTTEIERTLNFKVRSDDVWVVTMPKCGTTWMQETAWLVYNDFDFNTASEVPLMERSPFVEHIGILVRPGRPNTYETADNLKSPRLLKSHLPASLLPTEIWQKKAKIIYVARNVKDCVVSFYHFAKILGAFKGTKEEFVEAFMKDGLFYTPYWPHILEFYEMRNEPNIFFTSYERMKKDLKGVIKELCIFMEKEIPSEEILDKAVEHLSIDSMRKSTAGKMFQKEIIEDGSDINSDFQFLRRGIVGSYKDELPEDLTKKLDLWSQEFLKEANASNEEVFGL